MPKKVSEPLRIICTDRAYLEPLKVMGPIVHPVCVDKKIVFDLLMRGAHVKEYYPNEKVYLDLTVTNLNDADRFAKAFPNLISASVNEPIYRSEKSGVHTETETPNNNTPVQDDPISKESTHTTDTPENNLPVSDADFAKSINYSYNENGIVNESTINWKEMTKGQRRAVRAEIDRLNTENKK